MKNTIMINPGEGIFEPFWNPEISLIDTWKIQEINQSEASVTQQWASLKISWNQKTKNKSVISLSKKYSLDVEKFDNLLIYGFFPVGTKISITIEGNNKLVNYLSESYCESGKEIEVDIKDINTIEKIDINIIPSILGFSLGNINWIGLQNKSKLDDYLDQFKNYDKNWDGLLKSNFTPSFKPQYGFVIKETDLKIIRKRLKEDNFSNIDYKRLDRLNKIDPEKYISDYVNFWDDTRFERVRDYGKYLTMDGAFLAEMGIILENKEYLYLAARYALSLLFCKNWYDSFMCNFPLGTWEHRGFVPSIIAHQISVILDLAGDLFTDTAKNMFLRRLGENAQGTINFVSWKHDYMFHNNQIPWFSHGRILSALILNHHYSHCEKYLKIAYEDLIETFDNIIMEDGGYGEGPSYFNCLCEHALLGLYFYSNAKNVPFNSIIPKQFLSMEDFIQSLYSTDKSSDIFAICDGHPHLSFLTLSIMNYCCPNSTWSKILSEKIARSDNRKIDSIVVENLLSKKIINKVIPKTLINMEKLGCLSSYRIINNKELKIFINGNEKNVDHAHEDKGSFIIEFDNETFAMDSGSTDYSKPFASLLQLAPYHNMLVPYNCGERAHPNRPNKDDIKVIGVETEQGFEASIDLSNDWPGFYRLWKRNFSTPSKDTLLIKDSYEIEKGDGVIFYWKTLLDVKKVSNKIIINSNNSYIEIEVMDECIIEIKESPFTDKNTQKSIEIKKAGRIGTLNIMVKFY